MQDRGHTGSRACNHLLISPYLRLADHVLGHTRLQWLRPKSSAYFVGQFGRDKSEGEPIVDVSDRCYVWRREGMNVSKVEVLQVLHLGRRRHRLVPLPDV